MGQRMAKDQRHERMWPNPHDPEGSGGSDQVYIGRVPRVSRASRAHRKSEPIRGRPYRGVRKALGISIRPILPFIDQLGRDLGALGVPLSQ